ncbi:MAG: AAA family ATPase [Methylocystaceae bacterium]|nr:AAA family ATPase [Methylocystaceae bacterium]
MNGCKVSWAEFYKNAYAQHQLTFDNDKGGAVNRSLTLADLSTMDLPPQKFIMNNFFGAGELVILSGAAKTGKSYFLLDVLIAIARKGKISDRFYSNSVHRVALIDAELSIGELAKRSSQMEKLHERKTKWRERFVIVSAKHEKREFNLADKNDQQYLEAKIGDADIIAIDNYGKLSGLSGDSLKTWRQVTSWFDKLQQRGITILLIHHENKSDELRGTQKMVDDADLHISLKRPGNWRPQDGNIIEVSFPAARHLHGEQVAPFTVTYEEKNSQFRRYIGDPEETDIPIVSETEIEEHSLKPLLVDILTAARQNGKIQSKDIIDETKPGHSRTSVVNAFSKLCERGLLTQNGLGKGTFYTPPDFLT